MNFKKFSKREKILLLFINVDAPLYGKLKALIKFTISLAFQNCQLIQPFLSVFNLGKKKDLFSSILFFFVWILFSIL